MIINTASAAITFAKELESQSAKFYEELSNTYGHNQEFFQKLIKENTKNATNIQTAYYGVISDAIEGCFAFDINPDEYSLQTELPKGASNDDALARAVQIEETIMKFYSDAAEQSKPLMADVPRAFALIAKKRSSRISDLKSLLGKGE